jgi:hypothetical protein
MIFSPVQSPLQHQETKSTGSFPASSSDQDAAKKGFLISTKAIASQSSSLEMEEVEVELSCIGGNKTESNIESATGFSFAMFSAS